MASNIARPSLIKGAPLDCESCVTQSMQPSDRNLMQLLNWEKKCKAIQPLDEMDKILATLDTRMAAIEGWLDDHDWSCHMNATSDGPGGLECNNQPTSMAAGTSGFDASRSVQHDVSSMLYCHVCALARP